MQKDWRKFRVNKTVIRCICAPVAVFIMTLSTISFLPNAFIFFLSGFVREHNAIDINSENRPIIEALLPNDEENIPEFANAVKVDYLVLMHKHKTTISYEDGSEFVMYSGDKTPLIFYIKQEGYSLYFRSMEFVEHIIGLAIPTGVTALCIIVLKKVFSTGTDAKFDEQTKTNNQT